MINKTPLLAWIFLFFLIKMPFAIAQIEPSSAASQFLLNANGQTDKVKIAQAAALLSRNTEGGILTTFLRENHTIYTNRLPFEAIHLRSFILSCCANLIDTPDNRVYQTVRAELSYRGELSLVAAAARVARRFPDHANDLVPLLAYYLDEDYADSHTDIDSLSPSFVCEKPTKVRYEVIATLQSFGAAAFSTTPALKHLTDPLSIFSRDTLLQQMSITPKGK
jgi:hypothetical protein